MKVVSPADWADTVGEFQAAGFGYLDFLTGVDRDIDIEVIAHLLDPSTGERVLVSTRVPADAPTLPSVTHLLPAASWHERETAEMFGVAFDGHPDPRPLLLRTMPATPPLRKAAALTERVSTPWPGAADAEAGRRPRRRQLPPGVRESWVAEESS